MKTCFHSHFYANFHEFYEGQSKQQICYNFILLISIHLKWQPSINSKQELNHTVCSEEEMRAKNSKEAVILITNLSFDEASIPQHEIITDVTHMRTVANVHESW